MLGPLYRARVIIYKRYTMNIQKEIIDDLNALLKVKVEKEDYFESYSKKLKEYSKQAQLPGFRAGKVPVGIIKKRFGKSFLAEEIQKVLDKSIHEYIQSNKLNVLGQPLPLSDKDVGDWEDPSDFMFTYEIGLAPDFEVGLSTKYKVPYYTVKVDKKMADDEVDRVRRRYGSLSESSAVRATDMILGTLNELREDGLPKEGGITHSSTIGMEYIDDKRSKKSLLGKIVGDKVVVNPHKLSHSHDDLGRMLGITHEQVHALSPKAQFELSINEIKQLTPADLNEEFFAKVLPEGTDQSEVALRTQITDGLMSHFAKDSELLFKRDMSRYFAKKLKLSLPDEFLKKWIEKSGEKKSSKEEIEAGYEEYSNSIKWQLIKNKLISEQEIKVEFSEVMDFAMEQLRGNYMQYGMPAPPEEELKEHANRYLQNREQMEQLFDMLYEEKVLEAAKSNIKLSEKEVSFDKFKDIASK
jgi:trigger factor